MHKKIPAPTLQMPVAPETIHFQNHQEDQFSLAIDLIDATQ